MIINDGEAAIAKDIASIRKVLGVKASDNLTAAAMALVVEGDEDVTSLRAILKNRSRKLAAWLDSNELIIEPIGGAGNLPYKLSLLRGMLCSYHVLLDDDESGRAAANSAQDQGLLTTAACTYSKCPSFSDAELEDCFAVACYEGDIQREFGVDTNKSSFKGRDKWSIRMKRTFEAQGKQWNKSVSMQVKAIVASAVARSPQHALHEHKGGSILSLVEQLENMKED